MNVIRREWFEPLDLDEIRRDHPLPDVVTGAGIPIQRAGSEMKGCCPFHPDKSPSFTIFDGGRRFYCFGCGASGDVLDFLRRLHGVGLREAADMLTGGELPTVRLAPLPPASDEPDRREEARAIWEASQPITGTLAEVYLRWRCLHLPLPDSLRFAVLPYGKSGQTYPVLVAAVMAANGDLIGIQRTFLAGNGEGKAAVPKAKLSLGKVSGGAIHLAPPAASLIVTEGVEDALTLQQTLGVATWAAAGASMLPKMAFPDLVRDVAIGGDNDDAGRDAARKAAHAFMLRGYSSRVFFPVDAKDFNAELIERSPAQ